MENYWEQMLNRIETLQGTLFKEKVITKLNSYTEDEEYEYNDNYRAYVVGDEEGEELYSLTGDNGCCGYFDEFFTIDGVQVRIGFNYGH